MHVGSHAVPTPRALAFDVSCCSSHSQDLLDLVSEALGYASNLRRSPKPIDEVLYLGGGDISSGQVAVSGGQHEGGLLLIAGLHGDVHASGAARVH